MCSYSQVTSGVAQMVACDKWVFETVADCPARRNQGNKNRGFLGEWVRNSSIRRERRRSIDSLGLLVQTFMRAVKVSVSLSRRLDEHLKSSNLAATCHVEIIIRVSRQGVSVGHRDPWGRPGRSQVD